jgi:hypothetical protein
MFSISNRRRLVGRSSRRPSLIMVIALFALFAAGLPGASGVRPAIAQTDPPQVDNLAAIAQAQGTVRVIVQLRTAFQPEAELPDGPAVAGQRNGIAIAQQAVLGRLANRNVHNVTRFRFSPLLAMEVDADALRALASDPDVANIQEDALADPILSESVPLIGGSTSGGFGTANYTGSGRVVAILDTGVMKTHTFFTTGGSKVVSEACYSSNTSNATTVCPGGATATTAAGSGVNCSTAVNGCNHGTHVAGIAAGRGSSFSGVARNANIIAVQVFSRFNSSSDCGSTPAPCVRSYTSDQIKGLERVYTLRDTYNIAAVNMSLGGGQFFSDCDSDSRKPIIDNLRAAGIATVIASGNDGFRDSIGAPACISSAITVGSSTKTNVISSFSNMDDSVELMAPGSAINSAVTSSTSAFASFNGTSMATPHVAGAWAVMKQAKPTASVTEILGHLQATGLPIADTRSGGTHTRPRIRLDRAVNRMMIPACDDFEPNSTVAEATPVTVNGAGQLHRFCASNDHDWIRFSVVAGRTYRIYTYGLSHLTDTYMDVYSNAGTTFVRANDDDDSGSYGSTVIVTPTANGTYYARLRQVNNAGSSSYTYFLRVISSTPCNINEADDSAATAKWFIVGASQQRALCASGDQDWVRFRAKAGQRLQIETFDLGALGGGLTADTVLELYNTNGTSLLATNDDINSSFTRASRIEFTFPTNGYYYVKVRGFGNNGGAAHIYSLRINRIIPPPASSTLDKPADVPQEAPSDVAPAAPEGTLEAAPEE